MSSTTTAGINFPTESLAQTDKDVLIQIIEQLTNKLSSVKSELADVREDSDRLSRKVANTKSELADVREDTDRLSRKVANTNSRVSDLEDNADTDTSSCETSGSDNDESNSKGSGGESTPLEQVCALSEDESKEHLTANQSRARKVACRIHEYGKSVPAGVAITSSRMRDFLSGLEDKRIHRQTIQRVMDFLERLGDGHIDTKETRGGKKVTVFSETVVENITSVVTGETQDGVTPAII